MGPQEHAFRSGVDVIVGTPGRLLDHFRAALRQARRHRVPGPRRGGPHARHGFPARHPPRAAPPPEEAADAVLQRDDAAADRGADARDAARSGDDQPRAPRSRRRSGITQAIYPVLAAAQVGAAAAAAAESAKCRTRWSSRGRSTAPTGWRSYLAGKQGQRRAHPRQPLAGAADPGARGLQEAAATACWSRPTSRRAAST